MEIEFITQQWHLFLALIVIIGLIVIDPAKRQLSGAKSITAIDVPRIMNHESANVIDVSEAADFKKGHIPNAKNFPLGNMANDMVRLEKLKKHPIIVTCRMGQQSNKALAVLRKNNFEQLYSLKGGFAAWQKENYPIEK